MRKPLSIGAIAASAMLIGSTAIAVAGSESIYTRYLQLAQIPTDPPSPKLIWEAALAGLANCPSFLAR